MSPKAIAIVLCKYVRDEHLFCIMQSLKHLSTWRLARGQTWEDFLDIMTYDCPITGKKRCAVDESDTKPRKCLQTLGGVFLA